MPYHLAILAAQADADCYAAAHIEQDADNRRIVVRNGAQIVAIYAYVD